MNKNKKTKFGHKSIIFILAVIVLIALGLFILRSAQNTNPLNVSLDKSTYSINDDLKVTFKNAFSKDICFSSLYPYLLEKLEKDDSTGQYIWKPVTYYQTSSKSVASNCLPPSQRKAFLIKLSNIEKGDYRIFIPICINCKEGDLFRKDEVLYSPKFNIK